MMNLLLAMFQCSGYPFLTLSYPYKLRIQTRKVELISRPTASPWNDNNTLMRRQPYLMESSEDIHMVTYIVGYLFQFLGVFNDFGSKHVERNLI